ncbi:MAG: 23S rRNA (uracil(1939)-C(5))-methyltransferase RlmD [Desulfurivibrionaceae bacterium]
MMPEKSYPFLTIEKIVSGGYGLGRLPDGIVVLVPRVLPGEEVRVRPVRRRKNYIEARLIEVIRPSSLRVEPDCPYYGRCGGCDFQHLGMEDQLRFKSGILREQLLRFDVVPDEGALSAIWSEPLPSSNAFGYRQRIRLQVNADGRPGYFQFRSHTVEPIKSCLLARPEINSVLQQVMSLASMKHLFKYCRAVEFFLSPEDGRVILYLHFTRKPRPADYDSARTVQQDIAAVKGLVMEVEGYGVFLVSPQREETSTENGLEIRMTLPAEATGREISLCCEPGGFYQVNQETNEQLIKTVLEWAAVSGKDRVLDLFCGMGNFSLPLALHAGEVVGLDLQRAAIRSATGNAASAGLVNCRFEKSAARVGAAHLAASGEYFDLVLLDPPRQGCSDVISYIPKLGAARILYVSCDPATLARDLAALIRTGYNLSRIQPVDMFPQTHHMETVALLEKDG